MTALPYQPVPTAGQQRELERWVAKRYPIRQYEKTQALISPVEAAGIACCATEVDVPRPGEDGEPQVWEWVGSLPSVLIFAAACVARAAYWWSSV